LPKNLLKLKPLLLFFLVLAAACAGPGTATVLEDIAKDPLGGAYIRVPFFPDDEQLCGPAAMASVFNYYGADIGLDAISQNLYDEKLGGSLPVDLLIYAKENGFTAKYYEGGLEDLKASLAAGRPLILFLNMGLPGYPVGHYIVAVGYNDRYSTVIAHSGLRKEMLIGYRRLEAAWSMTGHSTLLLTPSDPAGAAR